MTPTENTYGQETHAQAFHEAQGRQEVLNPAFWSTTREEVAEILREVLLSASPVLTAALVILWFLVFA